MTSIADHFVRCLIASPLWKKTTVRHEVRDTSAAEVWIYANHRANTRRNARSRTNV